MTPDSTTEPVKPFLYKTADRGLAAAFMALGFDLLNVQHDEDPVIFVFAVSRMLLNSLFHRAI